MGTILLCAGATAADPVRASADTLNDPTVGPTTVAATGATTQPTAPPPAAGSSPIVQIDELSLDLTFEAETRQRTVRTDLRGIRQPRFAQTNRQYRFEETLGLETSGSLIDPRLLHYDLSLRGGLTQERFRESRPGRNLSTRPDGRLLEYDLRLQLFPAGRITASVFASQLDDRIARPFLPSLERRRERYGADLTYSDPILPMQLTYEHIDDDLTSRSRFLADDEQRGEDRLRYELTWQPTEYHALNLEYEYERRSEQFSGTRTRFDTQRNSVSLNHTLRFGPGHRSRLDTIVRLEEEDGDLDRDLFEVSPRLRLQHTDDLFSSYRFQFLKESYFDLESNTIRGDFDITHTFEDVLTTTLGLYALHQHANENADIDEWGALADVAFSKDNRLGRFSADLSYIHSQTRTVDARRDAIIASETVTFRDPLAAYLAHRNINLGTLLVMNTARTRLYIPGIDYAVHQTDEQIALIRLATGAILNQQTVFVSYAYRSARDTELTRDRLDLRIRQRVGKSFEGYYALSYQNESLDGSGFLTFRERDVNRHRVGMTYRRPRWSAGAEYEFNDDAIDAYQAGHFNGDVVFVQNARHQLEGRATLSMFRFDGEELFKPRNTILLDLGMSYRYVLGRELEANASAMYRFQNDSLFGETNGVDLTAGLAYRIGLFSLSVEGEYDMLDLPSSTDNSAGVWLRLRRDIPVIGKRVVR